MLHVSAVLVYLSAACPSRTQEAKDIVQLFSQPDNPVVLVSWGRLVLPNTKRNTLNRGVQYTLIEKFPTFD